MFFKKKTYLTLKMKVKVIVLYTVKWISSQKHFLARHANMKKVPSYRQKQKSYLQKTHFFKEKPHFYGKTLIWPWRSRSMSSCITLYTVQFVSSLSILISKNFLPPPKQKNYWKNLCFLRKNPYLTLKMKVKVIVLYTVKRISR